MFDCYLPLNWAHIVVISQTRDEDRRGDFSHRPRLYSLKSKSHFFALFISLLPLSACSQHNISLL